MRMLELLIAISPTPLLMGMFIIDHFNNFVSNISKGDALIMYCLNEQTLKFAPPYYIFGKPVLVSLYTLDFERVISTSSIELRSSN